MFVEQIKIVIKKNFVTSFRSHELYFDAILPLAIGFLMGLSFSGVNTVIYWIPFVSFTRSVVYSLLTDKANRYKELQKIMGLSSSAYNIAWLITFYIRGIIASLFFLIPASSFGVLNGATFDTITAWIMYFQNMILNINFSFFLSTFFSRPRIGAEIYLLLQLILSNIFYAYFQDSICTNTDLIILLTLFFPQSAMITSWIANSWKGTSQILFYSLGNAMLVMFIMSLFYLIAYLYFEQVIQSEYGSRKHPLFFIQSIFPSSNFDTKNSIIPLDKDITESIHKQEIDPKKYKISVQIKNLCKNFGLFNAVENVSLSLFEKQIFCLLGHNGAGKTTMIGMLTGLLNKSSGNVQFYSKDQDKNSEEARKYIGLCTQKDALYDKMTIEEHLTLIGQTKYRFGQILANDIEKVIKACALDDQRGKIAQILSGGNKRKLSLAMALIGGSKVIFLDEPTSGLDSLSRIQIRDIIRNMKNEDRTIVLTSHHLEEVEQLGDRTAILSKGNLLIVGTNQFISEKFGIGYKLTLTQKSNSNQSRNDFENDMVPEQMSFKNQKQKLIELVLHHIPNATNDPQSAEESLVFTLPYDQKDSFVKLFQKIEEEFLGIQINFEKNNLEDAFVNIGNQQQNFYKGEGRGLERVNGDKDIETLNPPQCLTNPPKFLFWNQLWALFLRRFLVTMRSASMIFTFIFPLLIQIGGVIIAQIVYEDYTVNNISDTYSRDFDILYLISNLLMFAYCLTMTGITASPVIDKETKLRYVLSVMGCRNTTYWIGAFIFDYLIMFFMLVIFTLVAKSMNVVGLSDYLGSIFAIITLSLPAFIGLMYLISNIYQKSKTIYLTLPWLLIIVLFLILQVTFLLQESSKSTFVRWIQCIISPFLAASNGLLVLVNQKAQQNISFQIDPLYPPSWQQPFPGLLGNPGTYMVINILQGILFISLSIFTDYQIQQIPNKSKNVSDTFYNDDLENQNLNSEVLDEITRIADTRCEDKIKVSKLSKTYFTKGKPIEAIRNSNFGVNDGEVFGLLGPNGAGKSTTFNIITSMISKTNGRVQLKGKDIKAGDFKIYQDVGICPQFDSLYDNLSVTEHLQLFGRMKGLTGSDLNESIDYFIKIMQLEDYKDKKAGQLSGGNKRKLCVTIAMIGGPDMQFFDEPSSGVDPIARRFLWNTLKSSLNKRNGAIVLTTHSMHEAETLCTKIAIQVNGKIQCLGSPDFLKQKYGNGYQIRIQLKGENNFQFFEEQIKQVIPKATKISDSDQENIIYQIENSDFKFSKVYQFLEIMSNTLSKNSVENFDEEANGIQPVMISAQNQNEINLKNTCSQNLQSSQEIQSVKKETVIEGFQIIESTLESVFIKFSSKQFDRAISVNK